MHPWPLQRTRACARGADHHHECHKCVHWCPHLQLALLRQEAGHRFWFTCAQVQKIASCFLAGPHKVRAAARAVHGPLSMLRCAASELASTTACHTPCAYARTRAHPLAQVEAIVMMWALIVDRKNFWQIVYRWGGAPVAGEPTRYALPRGSLAVSAVHPALQAAPCQRMLRATPLLCTHTPAHTRTQPGRVQPEPAVVAAGPPERAGQAPPVAALRAGPVQPHARAGGGSCACVLQGAHSCATCSCRVQEARVRGV